MDRTARSARSVFEADNIIDITEDEDNEMPLDPFAPNPALNDLIVIDEEEEDDLTLPPSSHYQEARPGPLRRRNEDPQWPERYINTCKLLDERARNLGPTACNVKIGDTVEVRESQSGGHVQAGDFLRVMKIIENTSNGKIKLRGLPFRRSKYLRPMIRALLNEVCMVVTVDEEDPRPYQVQGLEEIPLVDAFRKRRLTITDLPFPMLSYREQTSYYSRGPDAKQIGTVIAETDVLVCRNVFTHIYGRGDRQRNRRRPWQGLLRPILYKEADNGDGLLTNGHAEVDLPLESDDDDVVVGHLMMPHGPNRPRQYTFGDACQGAGGVTCAAKLAGLKISWGFDNDETAVATASSNFRQARIFQCEAAEFPPSGFDAQCDILHISPPCQPFSQANTNPNRERNERNTDCLFTIPHIIEATKPKIVTMEEVPGLLSHHPIWFGKLVSLVHEQGYSIRWAIQNVLDFEVSQPRKRLVFIAAAPGIPLPNMPKPTRGGPGSNLPPYLTAREAIGNIPRFAALHDPRPARNNKEPWDPDRPYHKTLTTNSDAWHWGGRRKLTLRELAGIQGFPHTYKFTGTNTAIEKQIGNAVPPPWFKLVFEECIKVLRKVDRIQGRSGRADPRREGNDDEVNMFRPASRTLSPAPPTSSQGSGNSVYDAIVIDGDEDNIIEID